MGVREGVREVEHPARSRDKNKVTHASRDSEHAKVDYA